MIDVTAMAPGSLLGSSAGNAGEGASPGVVPRCQAVVLPGRRAGTATLDTALVTGRPGAEVVLAAVDDSDATVAVARAAGEAALTRGGEVVVLTVVGVLPEHRALARLGWIDEPESVGEDAEATFGRVRPILDRLGVSYRTRVGAYVVRGGRWSRARRIARTIQRAADREAASLVVIAHAHGQRPARSSVARCLLRRSTGDVLAVPVSAPSSPATETPTVNRRRHDIASAS